MKTITYSLLSVLILSSCRADLLLPHISHIACYERDSIAHRNLIFDIGTEIDADPSLYFCVVDYDNSYDWIRDTLYGYADYNLILYRDYRPILTIPSSCGLIRPEADTHHIVQGQLYTEIIADNQTIISRNGVELMRFDGESCLIGLLPVDEDVYTILKDIRSDKHTIRINKTILLELTSATMYGDMYDNSYGSTGALYIDNDQVCFAYKSDGVNYVQQGEQRVTLAKTNLQDIKVMEGDIRTIGSPYYGYTIGEARLWRLPQKTVSAHIDSDYYVYFREQYMSRIARDLSIIFIDEIYYVGILCHDSNTSQYIYGNGVFSGELEDDYRLMNSKCAAFYNGDCYVGVSPIRNYDYPMIIHNQQKQTLKIHGYISNMAVCVPPP